MTITNYSKRIHSLGVLYVDIYPWRKSPLNDIEFLLLKRNEEVELSNTWQTISGKILEDEKISDAFWRLARKRTGTTPLNIFKIDYVNVFYDSYYDTVMHVPVAAAEIECSSDIALSDLHVDYMWASMDEALQKLIWPNQKKSLYLIRAMIKKNMITRFHYLENKN
ncbi:NUDIX domain-containing protein [Kalamiella sp. sgz302252]|uniref:NUDIX domain-containing protein n=1 Tax=Pantoea sp. sgz302252 TaxID=3341827 RepID=UPI0036D2FA25